MELKRKHPIGLYLLFSTEMWERFSYYGMRALLILYLTKEYVAGGLAFSDSSATLLYGFFTGAVYCTPLIGGWLANEYIGLKRSVLLGAVIMMLGQFCLAAQQSATFLYVGLVLLVVGNGFFKPNISTMVGHLYPPNDERRDSAYTIFYMGINVGAFFSPLVAGYFAFNYGYRYGFLAAGIGMLIGAVSFWLLSNKLLPDMHETAHVRKQNLPKEPLTPEEKDRIKVIVVLSIFCTIFFAGFEQAGSSMSLYTEKYIDRSIGDFIIPTEWFQSANPLFIIVLAPLFSMLWQYLSRKKKDPSIPVKMGLGMILLGVGFLFMLGAAMQRGGDVADETIKANLLFLLFTYFLHTMGELCLSPIGLSMVNRLSPVRLASMLMGVWFLTSAFANVFGAVMASYIPMLGASVIFGFIALISIVFGGVLLLLNNWLKEKSHGVF